MDNIMDSKKEDKVQKTSKLFIDKRYYFVIAGLLAMGFAYLGFAFSGMLKNGSFIIERGDLLEIFVSYIKMMYRHILNGESIWYSFDLSMGMNTALSLTFYAFSPFNILFLLLNRVDDNIVVTIIILLKIGFSASAFQIFSKYTLKNDNVFSILFSICYALCGFTVAYGTINILWLDGIIVLPLLCYFLTKAKEDNKYVPLTLCYAYLFISQFYIGYMIGIFSLLYLVAILIYRHKKGSHFEFKTVIFWLLSVIIAIFLSAFVWVPTLLFLLKNTPPDATQFTGLNGITIFKIINSMFWGQYIDTIGAHSYSYSGIPVLLIVPFYFINKKISTKEKVLSGAVLLFLIGCYIIMPLNMLMHAFDAPDFFWYRFSFLLSFVLCTLATRQSAFLKEIKPVLIPICPIVLIFIYLIAQKLESFEAFRYSANSLSNLIINVCIILVWLTLYVLYRNANTNRKIFLSVCLLFIIGIEEITNFYTYMGEKTSKIEYYNWENSVKAGLAVIQEIEKDNSGFYRVIINNDLTHNSDTLFGYNGVCDFGSSENYKLRKTLSNLGFGTTTRLTYASGYNPVSNMLLGVRYVVHCFIDYDNIYTAEEMYQRGIFPSIETYNTLQLGYMVEDDMKNYTFPSRNVFINMNDLLNKMSGLDGKCFMKISEDNIEYICSQADIQKVNEASCKYLLSFDDVNGFINISVKNNNYDNVYIQFQTETPNGNEWDYEINGYNIVNGNDYRLNTSASTEMFYNSEDDEFVTQITATETSAIQNDYDDINVYSFDKVQMTTFYNNLSKEQLQVEEYKAGYVKGKISIDSNRRILLTTIPYDQGWTVWLNNEKANTFSAVDNAFLAVEIPNSGDYTVLMKYEAPGVRAGSLISLFGIVCLIILFLVPYYSKTNK